MGGQYSGAQRFWSSCCATGCCWQTAQQHPLQLLACPTHPSERTETVHSESLAALLDGPAYHGQDQVCFCISNSHSRTTGAKHRPAVCMREPAPQGLCIRSHHLAEVAAAKGTNSWHLCLLHRVPASSTCGAPGQSVPRYTLCIIPTLQILPVCLAMHTVACRRTSLRNASTAHTLR